jgi:hypothetical protein
MAKQVKDAGSAANTAARTGATRARRTVFGMACLCVLGLAAFLGSGAPAAGADTACPNESFRVAQHATQLPDCRAFEKVSPAEKGNGDIVGDGRTTMAAVAGDAVVFNTRTPFGDTVGSGGVGQTQYVGRRTDQGWDIHSVTPAPRSDANQVFFSPTILQIYSDDLRTAVLRGYDLPGASDEWPAGWPPRNNIYVEDTATRDLQTVTLSQVDTPTLFDFLQYPQTFWGISANARHVAFVALPDQFFGIVTQFLPNATPGVPNVYQWDDGVLHLVGILPDGTVPSGGSDQPANYRGAVSADGSRTLFVSPAPTEEAEVNPQLYQRIDNDRTVWISEPEYGGSFEPNDVQLKGATPDGHNVFFTTSSRLLEEDESSGTDLYRWTDSPNPVSEDNLTLISQDGDLSLGEFIGMSDDGERVYYQTTGSKLLVWNNGNTLIRVVPPANFSLAASPGNARVTPDGMFLAFRTNTTVDGGVHGLTGEVTNSHQEMYLYSLADDTLICVSCPPGPATADVTVLPAATQGLEIGNAGFRPRFLSDGGRVFFSTADALVSQDTNGVLDAYQYDSASGEVSLLSSGTGKDPSTFADASASGDDVFIATRQRLVPSDRDELVDLYDVGVNRGLPEPEDTISPPCQAEGCKPAPSAPPAAPPSGTSGLAAGNLHRRVHCSKNKRKVRRNGKVRCVNQRHQSGRRHARANRRAAR